MKSQYYLKCFWLLKLLLLTTFAIGQTSKDSAIIVNIPWQEIELQTGLKWKRWHSDSLFKSHQEINIIEIDLQNKKRKISIGYVDSLRLTSDIAKEANALAAINGSFFDTKKGGGVTVVKVDGKIISHNTENNKKHQRTERANAALLIKRRKVQIVSNKQYTDTTWGIHLSSPNVMVAGPILVDADTIVALEKDAFNTNRHPRSAIALFPNKRIWLLTVDGRNTNAQGMSLNELAYLLHQLGAQQVINLDGGGSSTLYIKGMGENGVVNYPSDNKKWDHAGERKVANCILVY